MTHSQLEERVRELELEVAGACEFHRYWYAATRRRLIKLRIEKAQLLYELEVERGRTRDRIGVIA